MNEHEQQDQDVEQEKDDAERSEAISAEEPNVLLFAEDFVESARRAKREKRNNVLIFVFLAVMVLLMIGAVVFVICVTGGAASGCNCGQC